MTDVMTWLAKRVFFPLWEINDGAHRHRHFKELECRPWWGLDTIKRQQWQQLRECVRYASLRSRARSAWSRTTVRMAPGILGGCNQGPSAYRAE